MVHYKDVASEIANDIVKDVKKRAMQAIEYVAQQIRDDWEQQARRVMDAYYSDYDPKSYDRTNELRNIIVPVFNKNGDSYEVGIEFDPTLMNHNLMTKSVSAFGETGFTNRITEEDIFKNFMYGAHGNEDYTNAAGKKVKREIHFTSPSPMQMLDNYYYNYDSKFERFWKEALLKF